MVARYNSSTIMWALDGAPLTSDANGEWVRYADHLASRSAPEAVKAVDAPRVIACDEDNMPERIWAGDFDESGFGHCVAGKQGGLYAEYIRVDLASVAPSGAEPIGWQWKTLDTWHTIDKSSVADPETYAKTQAGGGEYRTIYTAPQAVPAEDIADTERQIYQAIDDLVVNDDGAVPWTHVANARDEVRRIVAAQPENIRPLLDELSRLREVERERDETLAEIERMIPKYVAYEYLESPAGREMAEARVAQLEKALGELVDGVQEWCDAVGRDTSWDSWDHHYKHFAYGGLDAARAISERSQDGGSHG